MIGKVLLFLANVFLYLSVIHVPFSSTYPHGEDNVKEFKRIITYFLLANSKNNHLTFAFLQFKRKDEWFRICGKREDFLEFFRTV